MYYLETSIFFQTLINGVLQQIDQKDNNNKTKNDSKLNINNNNMVKKDSKLNISNNKDNEDDSKKNSSSISIVK